MEVDLNELQRIRDYLNNIDKTPLESITWIKDGSPININNANNKVMRKWKLAGLTNSELAYAVLIPEEMKFSLSENSKCLNFQKCNLDCHSESRQIQEH